MQHGGMPLSVRTVKLQEQQQRDEYDVVAGRNYLEGQQL
jgi:hypothetical protein